MPVWLFRHGVANVGATDPPLSEQGRVQAARVAAALRAVELLAG
jgi:broad specificity phosphatase PhoE